MAQLLQDAHRQGTVSGLKVIAGAPPFGVAFLFRGGLRAGILIGMNPVELTRKLIDIESITGKEGAVATYLASYLEELGYVVERMPVEGERFNVFARPANVDEPALVFSTHIERGCGEYLRARVVRRQGNYCGADCGLRTPADEREVGGAAVRGW